MAKSTTSTKKASTKKATTKANDSLVCTSMKDIIKMVGNDVIDLYSAKGDRLYFNVRGKKDEYVSLTLHTYELVSPKGKKIVADFCPSTIYRVMPTTERLLGLRSANNEPLCRFVNNAETSYLQVKAGYMFSANCTPNEDGIHYDISSITIVPKTQ